MHSSGAGPESKHAAPGEQGSPAAASGSLSHVLLSLFNDVPGLISDRVHLLALELRRARQSLVRMILLVVVAAILAVTAWVAFWGFVAVVAAALGMPWYGVLASIALLNGLGAWLAMRGAHALVDDLTLPATLRRLTLAPSPSPAAGQPYRDRGAPVPPVPREGFPP